jgi:hypothetical protein
MSSDLVKRLREFAEHHAQVRGTWGDPYDPKNGIFWAAAERIEALEGEVAEANLTANKWMKERDKESARAERLLVALNLYERAEQAGTSDAYEIAHSVRKIELEDDKQ